MCILASGKRGDSYVYMCACVQYRIAALGGSELDMVKMRCGCERKGRTIGKCYVLASWNGGNCGEHKSIGLNGPRGREVQLCIAIIMGGGRKRNGWIHY
jgi:hypothetical protein